MDVKPLVVYDATSTGPVSSMPGSVHTTPDDAACITHEDRRATHRVQGETDSFGCEYHDLCQECYDAHKIARVARREQEAVGTCDWCANHALDLRNARDFDEGMAGRLYRVCGACMTRRTAEAQAELDAAGYYYDQDYDFDPVETEQDEGGAAEFGAAHEAEFEPSLIEEVEESPVVQPKAWVDGKYIW